MLIIQHTHIQTYDTIKQKKKQMSDSRAVFIYTQKYQNELQNLLNKKK